MMSANNDITKQKEKGRSDKLRELWIAAHAERPRRWNNDQDDYLDGEWYDDDADCFCD